MRKFSRWHESGPLIITCATHRKQSGPVVAHGREPSRMLADIAFAVGVNNVLGRDFPARHGGFECLPTLSAVHCQRGQIASSSWFPSYPLQGKSSSSIVPEHWAMTGKFQVHLNGRSAANPEAFLPQLHLFPPLRSFVLGWIGWIQLFNVKILLIQTEDGETPGDVLIVSQRDAR